MNDDVKIEIDTPSNGFMKGNLFKNLYIPYKNYKPKNLEFKDQKSRMLKDILEAGFAMHEVNLYLDLHPDDTSMIELFNDYRRKMLELTEEYESLYGPLNLTSDYLDVSPFLWEELGFFFGGNKDVGI